MYALIVGLPMYLIQCILKTVHWESELSNSLCSLITYTGAFILTIFYGLQRQGRRLKKVIGASPTEFWQGLNILAVILGIIALGVIIEQSSTWIRVSDSYVQMMKEAMAKNLFSIVSVVVAAPVLEEVLCRGIILNGLLKNYKPSYAIFLSALFFGFMHLNVWQGIPTFLAGLFLGWLYYRYNSVVPGIIAHAVNNTICYYFVFFSSSDKQDWLSILGTRNYLFVLFASVIVFSSCCYYIALGSSNKSRKINAGITIKRTHLCHPRSSAKSPFFRYA
jgi:membrane protease YdiL (CAAX protease family)